MLQVSPPPPHGAQRSISLCRLHHARTRKLVVQPPLIQARRTGIGAWGGPAVFTLRTCIFPAADLGAGGCAAAREREAAPLRVQDVAGPGLTDSEFNVPRALYAMRALGRQQVQRMPAKEGGLDGPFPSVILKPCRPNERNAFTAWKSMFRMRKYDCWRAVEPSRH